MKVALASLVLGALVLGGAAFALRERYVANGPATYFADEAEHFKYGSYGSEVTGLPLPLWQALPSICPTLLPGGWQALGFRSEPGKEVPIGVSVRKYGVPRVGLNCAACHAGVLEGSPGVDAKLVLGMPNPRFDAQAYSQFILGCLTSEQFTTDNVFRGMEQARVELSWLDRFVYRKFVIDQAREQAVGAKQQLAWMDSRPKQGPGRTDTANLFRMVLKQNPGGDDVPGTVDFPSLWNQGPRAAHGGGQHWDGDNDSFRERSYTSALASGATEDSLDVPGVDRVSEWIANLPAPRYPFPIDAAKAELGKTLWIDQKCGDCHDFGPNLAGTVTPLDTIGTDPGRVTAFTAATADTFKTLGVGKPWHITHYRKTNGYLNVWTDGVWARAPYLHNGSVPTLYDLLLPPEQRPREFHRGCSTLDPQKVGWACSSGFRYRTDLPGNGNSGHRYGTTLRDEERWALVEYMKTL